MNGCADHFQLGLDDINDPQLLIYGIGNVGREDDGLGWAFVDDVKHRYQHCRADVRYAYQLSLEDADIISRYERVLFVDSTCDVAVQSFAVIQPEPKLDLSFTSHALSVSTILAVAQHCFGDIPQTHIVAIRGYQWNLHVGLTALAQNNLNHAVESLFSTA